MDYQWPTVISRLCPTLLVLIKMLKILHSPDISIEMFFEKILNNSNGRGLIPLNAPRLEYLVGNVC